MLAVLLPVAYFSFLLGVAGGTVGLKILPRPLTSVTSPSPGLLTTPAVLELDLALNSQKSTCLFLPKCWD